MLQLQIFILLFLKPKATQFIKHLLLRACTDVPDGKVLVELVSVVLGLNHSKEIVQR